MYKHENQDKRGRKTVHELVLLVGIVFSDMCP